MALGRLVLCERERVIALEPYGKGLLGTTLRYLYEVRDAKDYFGHLPELALAPDMLALAAQILESKVADFDPHAFRDRYEEALLAHLKAKQDGVPVQERNPTSATPRGVDQSRGGTHRGRPIARTREPLLERVRVTGIRHEVLDGTTCSSYPQPANTVAFGGPFHLRHRRLHSACSLCRAKLALSERATPSCRARRRPHRVADRGAGAAC